MIYFDKDGKLCATPYDLDKGLVSALEEIDPGKLDDWERWFVRFLRDLVDGGEDLSVIQCRKAVEIIER